MEKEKNYILKFFTSWIIKIIIIIILIIISLFIFCRYTGLIKPVIWNWQYPVVSLIETDKTEGYVQNNDQLWVNVNFDRNHSNVKKAEIWLDNDIQNSQELLEGSNTYIFRDLYLEEEGQTEFEINYQIEWSLFGEQEGTLGVAFVNPASTLEITEINRSENSFETTVRRTGDYYTFGEAFPNLFNDTEYQDLSTVGYYYINTDSLENLRNHKLNQDDILDALDESFVYNGEISKGYSTKEWTEIHTLNSNSEQTKPINFSEKNLLICFGIAKSSNENQDWFLSFSIPFYANYYGIPEITNLILDNNNGADVKATAYINENNYDDKSQNLMHFTIFSGSEKTPDEYVDDIFISYDSDWQKFEYTFEDILDNEVFFPNGVGVDQIYYYIDAEMWYGSNEKPVYDKDNPGGGNYDKFKHSNIVSEIGTKNRPSNSYDSTPEYQGAELKTLYNFENDTSTFSPYLIWIKTEGASWTGDNPSTYADLYISSTSQSEILYAEDIYEDSISGDDFLIYNNQNGIHFESGDTVTFRLEVTTDEYDWFNDPTGNELIINYEFYLPIE